MPETFAIVLATAANEAKGRQIALAALEARLAACVQMHPISSCYVWNGVLCEETETALSFKIRDEDFAALSALIRSLHDYEVPEILKIEVADGDAAYLGWLARATKRPIPS
jgi:periplasmic divalent cation tolerance protein